MKKRKSMLIGYALVFLVLLIVESYCLLNFGGDYVTIGGVGIILLIFAYLLLDVILETTEKPYGEYHRQDSSVSKEMYMNQKRGFSMLEVELKAQRELNQKLLEDLTKLITAEIKYERENAKQIIANNKKKLEQLNSSIEELSRDLQRELRDVREALMNEKNASTSTGMALKEYQLSIEGLRQQMISITDILRHMDNRLVDSPSHTVPIYMNMPQPAVMQQIPPETQVTLNPPVETEPESQMPEEPPIQLEPQIESEPEVAIEEWVPETEVQAEPESMTDELQMEPESMDLMDWIPEEEPPIPAPVVSTDPNKPMNPDEIEALIASMGIAPESVPEPEPEPVPEPVLEPEPEPMPVPVPEPTPAPAVSTDPNKMMSPEDIAALIASMN